MKVNELLQLPSRIAAARSAAGLSQRAAAKLLGMHASQLCGMERGRLRIARPDFLVEFSRAVGLDDGQLQQLRWALAHDQVVVEASEFGLSDAALELVSTSLQIERELSKEAVAGIRRSLRRTLRGQREISAWESCPTVDQEEDAMT